MSANTSPIFTLAPRISWTTAITAANTAMDGTGTVTAAFTAGANGSFVQRVVARALGTNVASVARVFINNGASSATPANNALFIEILLPLTTASNSVQQPDFQQALNFALPASYVINIALGTAVAAGWIFTVVGGDY